MKDSLISKRDTPDWRHMLEQAREAIKDALLDYPNFVDVYFTDGYNGNILMTGQHQAFPNAPYGGYFVINSRLSNLNHTVDEFIKTWKEIDNDAYMESYRDMLTREGETHEI